MANEKQVLVQIDIDNKLFIDKISGAKDRIKELKDERQKLQTAFDKALASGATDEIEDLNRALEFNSNLTAVANENLKRAKSEYKDFGLQAQATVGSYEQVYRQWRLAEVALKQLGGTLKVNKDGTRELTAEYLRAKKETEQLKDAVLAFNSGIKDGRLNVGNYTQSIQQAIQSSGLFGNSLNVVKGAIGGVTDGFKLLKDGTELVQQGIKNAINGVLGLPGAVAGAFGAATTAVKDFGSSVFKAKEETDGLQGAARGMTALKVATDAAAASFKLLSSAIALTGIGLLVIALGGLIAFFTKTNDGIDKIERGLSFLNGAFTAFAQAIAPVGEALFNAFTQPKKALEGLVEYVKSVLIPTFTGLKDIVVGLFTLDFDQLKKGGDGLKEGVTNAVAPAKFLRDTLDNAGAKALEAGKAFAQITRESQALEDVERKYRAELEASNIKLKEKLTIAKDTTLSEQDRRKALEEAAAIEQSASDKALEISRKKLALEERRLKFVEATGAAEETLFNLQAEVARQEAQSAATREKIAKSFNSLDREINKERLNNTIARLNIELAREEAAGNATTDLKLRILRQQTEAQLNEVEKGSAEAQKIELDYQAARIKILADAEKQRQAIIKQTQDIEISLILDGQTREIEQAKIALARKLADIKGQSAEEQALRVALTEQTADIIRGIADKYADEDRAKRIAGIKQAAEEQLNATSASEQKLTDAVTVALEKRRAALAESLAAGEISEIEYNDRILRIERQAEQERTQIAIDGAIQRAAIVQQQLAAEKLAREQGFADERARLEEQIQTLGLSTEEAEARRKALKKQQDDEARAADIEARATEAAAVQQVETLKTDAVIKGAQQRTKAATDEAKARKAINAELIKTSFDLSKELVGLLSASDEARKKNAGLIKLISAAEVAMSLQKEIAGYWEGVGKDSGTGGNIIGGGISTALAVARTALAVTRAAKSIQTINAQAFAEGGFEGEPISAPAAMAYRPTVYGGGMTDGPVMWKLAGEAGREYVAPDWQLKQAPGLFASLEQWRRTKVMPFADGGFTANTVSSPIMSNEALEQAIARGFAQAPAPVVTVEDINTVQTRTRVVENRANI